LDTGIEPADSNATANIATTVTFNFTGATNSTWTVPKGTTKQLTVWVDSRDFKAPTSGRTGTIQISAQASANNCKFGTNNGAGTYGGTAFAEGDKIFRNNIYANVLGGI
jgi:hypothetical protein